jgi:hypothetical protein
VSATVATFTLQFTTLTNIAVGGKIVVVAPTGWVFAAVVATDITMTGQGAGAAGTAVADPAITNAGRTLTIERTGGAVFYSRRDDR